MCQDCCFACVLSTAAVFCGAGFGIAFVIKLQGYSEVQALHSIISREHLQAYSRQGVIFGHIHIPKTAGSTINGKLALNSENVCGHKGYSYDYAHAQASAPVRVQASAFSRMRVLPKIMEEIGFEDCDFISHETSWQFWTKLNLSENLELHLPCREPIDHLMSQCNHKKIKFSCSKDFVKEITKCLIGSHKMGFSARLNNSFPNITLKCFAFERLPDYLKYMDERLQRKRHQREYVFRAMNAPRTREKECVWTNESVTLRDKISKYLISEADYYSFCDRCLHSKQDLFHQDDAQMPSP